ncbi:hypothetical protein MQM1_039 [Aeromonas phage vB_AsaP_MQM1]|nr:hypothetical protein MQM1_039 [Aeromonas phage vB_AsaP_MQM1]
MRPTFDTMNESATEQTKRLKGIRRQDLVDGLAATIEAVKVRHKGLPVEFLVQCRPFSTNKMSGARKTFESKEYLEFRDLIARKAGGVYGITGDEKFKLIVLAAFSNKRSDLDNTFKPLLDSMVGSMDKSFDDSQVYAIEARKRIVPKGQEYLQVRLEVIPNDEYELWWVD